LKTQNKEILTSDHGNVFDFYNSLLWLSPFLVPVITPYSGILLSDFFGRSQLILVIQ